MTYTLLGDFMSKIFKMIGLFSLVVFTFFYTNKTVSVIKEQDEIMIKIKQYQNKYNSGVIESIINNDTIIPGIKGNKVNINKSYENMKKIGIYNSNYYIFDTIYPKEKLNNNKDKYIISGNKKINNVSLIFIVNEITSINKILQILDKENVKSDFFITDNFINNNSYITNYLINNNHSINYYGDYSSSDFIINNTIIKSKFNQKNSYCYLEIKNSNYLNNCFLNKNYTIIPNIIIKNNMLNKVKKEIKNGSIISIYTSNITELTLTIKYIKSKGYNIVKLDEIFDL